MKFTDEQVKTLGQEIGSAIGKELARFLESKFRHTPSMKNLLSEALTTVVYDGSRHSFSLSKVIGNSISLGFQGIQKQVKESLENRSED